MNYKPTLKAAEPVLFEIFTEELQPALVNIITNFKLDINDNLILYQVKL